MKIVIHKPRSGGVPTDMPSRFFYRLGAWTVRRRFWVIGFWILAIVASAPFAPNLAGELSTAGFDVPHAESVAARNLVEREFSRQPRESLIVVYSSEKLLAEDPAFKRVVAKSAEAVEDERVVGNFESPYAQTRRPTISKDGHVAIGIVPLHEPLEEAIDHSDRLVEKLETAETKDVSVEVTGSPPIWNDFVRMSEEDLVSAEQAGLPIAALVLLFAFASLIAAGVPIVLGLVGIAIAFALLFFLAQITELNVYVQNASAMIGLGLGIDYSLLMIARFREELRNGVPAADAVARTMGTAGRAVFFSGLTVVVAVSGMWLVPMGYFHSFAAGVSIVALITILAALTLLPAVLSLLGRRINSLRIPLTFRGEQESRLWQSWARAVMARPVLFLVLSLGIVGAASIPFLSIRLGPPGPEVIPPGTPSRVALEKVESTFGEGEMSSLTVVVRLENKALEPDSLDALRELSGKLEDDGQVRRVFGVNTILDSLPPGIPLSDPQGRLLVPAARSSVDNWINTGRDGQVTSFLVFPRHDGEDDRTLNLVRRIREDIVPSVSELETAEVLVGGRGAENLDFNDEIMQSIPRVIGIVFLLAFIVLLVLFRSIVIPLKAVITNGLSVAAAYGLLVLIFQRGIGDAALGFEAPGFVGNTTPITLFSILFGLSMDYEVFLLSRIREAYDRTGDNQAAIAEGLMRTGRIITSAALIMIVVFGSFALTRLIPVKEIGLGLAIAIFLDATIVRVILVPSTMRLLGRWNWWLPKPLARILPAPAKRLAID